MMYRARIPGLYALCLLTQLRSAWTLRDSSHSETPPKIAIIGGGIGGTSTAYFLKEFFGDDVILDVYESGSVGGRLATIPIAGNQYEVGGSIIHPKNQYMVDFASKFGLAQRKSCSGEMGLFDGKEYVYKDSSWKFLSIAKLIWRYGFDVYRLHQLTEEMLDNFARIYTLQTAGHAYRDVGSMLQAMDPRFLEMIHSSSAAWLKAFGFHDLMIDELVMAVTQCNYGQTSDIQAFVGAVAVAAADPNLWAVSGGNKRVAEELLEHSRAALLRRTVREISPADKGMIKVTSLESDTPDKRLFVEGNPDNVPDDETEEIPRTQDYDIVVIAAPLTEDKSSLKFLNFSKEFTFPGRYERILCTMVQGKLNPYSLLLTKETALDEILVTNPKLIFNSIGKQYPVDVENCGEYPDVWKIFSGVPLGEEQLNIFFSERNSTDVIDWLAYPHYESDQRLADFELLPGLYHVNAVEWAGSAMEMSVIGAKNVALLAYKYWMQDPDAGRIKPRKDEL